MSEFHIDEITVGKKKKKIVENVHGQCRPGEILAIMGKSGSGKSVLLNLLSNTLPKNMKYVATLHGFDENTSSYLPSSRTCFNHLTCRENILLAARLYNTEHPLEETENVIKELDLSECADLQSGSTFLKKGCSDGQIKRIEIAMQLMKPNLSILLLDEPTSSLDSLTAFNLIKTLKVIANTRRLMVIISIHQPSWKIACKMDRLLVLHHGLTVYYGDSGESLKMFVKNTQDLETPIEALIDNVDSMEPYIQPISTEVSYENDKKVITEKNSLCYKWRVLSAFLFKSIFLTPEIFYPRLVCLLSASIVFGLIFFQLPSDQSSILTFMFMNFELMCTLCITGIVRVIHTVQDLDRLIIHNRNRMVSIRNYFSLRLVIILFENLTFSAFILIPIHYMSNDPADLSITFLYTYLLSVCSDYIYVFNSLVFKKLELSILSSLQTVLLLGVIDGYVVPIENVTWLFKWIYYFNPFHFAIVPYSHSLVENLNEPECRYGKIWLGVTTCGILNNMPGQSCSEDTQLYTLFMCIFIIVLTIFIQIRLVYI